MQRIKAPWRGLGVLLWHRLLNPASGRKHVHCFRHCGYQSGGNLAQSSPLLYSYCGLNSPDGPLSGARPLASKGHGVLTKSMTSLQDPIQR